MANQEIENTNVKYVLTFINPDTFTKTLNYMI